MKPPATHGPLGMEHAATALAPELLRAYHAAEYHVHSEPPFTLRIGAANADLRALHQWLGVTCSAYITAVNPRSTQLEPDANAARMQALALAVAALNLHAIPGAARDPTGAWPEEPSLLVPGLGLHTAQALGARWEQNALVWCDADAVARLILLR